MHRFSALFFAVLAGLSFGWLSVRQMMDLPARASTDGKTGAWHEVAPAGDSFAAFYTMAHFLSRGQVPPPADVRLFVREKDDDGNALRGECLVTLHGRLPPARWWFVSSERDGEAPLRLDAGHAILDPDGAITVNLARAPAPGNWIALESDGAYTLELVLHEPATGTMPPLPSVKRGGC